jgi:hypothetical protein
MPLDRASFPGYVLISFPVVAVVGWILICFLISTISGWHALAEDFSRRSDPLLPTCTAGPFFYTVYMRYWSHYSGIIRITAADDALYLSVFALFRPGHPPLAIPWREVQIATTKFAWQSYVLLSLGNRQQIPMRISERMASNLGLFARMAAGPAQTQLRSWGAGSP